MKRFNIVVAREDGGVEVFPMKEWLRQHGHRAASGLLAQDPSRRSSIAGLSLPPNLIKTQRQNVLLIENYLGW